MSECAPVRPHIDLVSGNSASVIWQRRYLCCSLKEERGQPHLPPLIVCLISRECVQLLNVFAGSKQHLGKVKHLFLALGNLHQPPVVVGCAVFAAQGSLVAVFCFMRHFTEFFLRHTHLSP